MILDVYHATLEDAMSVADVMLFQTLNTAVDRKADRRHSEQGAALRHWNQKWSYLFSTLADLPPRKTLRYAVEAPANCVICGQICQRPRCSRWATALAS